MIHNNTSVKADYSASVTLSSQWKVGPVKVGPLAAISTIEKYLMCRGMHIAPTQSAMVVVHRDRHRRCCCFGFFVLVVPELDRTGAQKPGGTIF